MTYRNKEPKKSCVIRDFCGQFKINNEILCDIMKRLSTAIKLGLAKETHDSATVKCYPSYVQDLPTGKETGNFVAIDLSGVSFRILLVSCQPEKKVKIDSRVYSVPDDLISGNSDQFFGYIADSVETFKTSLKLGEEEYWVSLCFAYPFRSTSLNSGQLTTWTKRFNVQGVVGKDVVALLQHSLDKKKLNFKVKSIVNDTVGCLMSCAWKDPNCRIGVIVGSGTNSAYMEKIENVELVDDKSKPYMVVNTEWGNFGSDGSLNDIVTDIDRELDRSSIRPGVMIFEKMTSSMYLCELIRICMIKCAESRYLFQGEVTERMKTKGSFLPEFIFDIERDEGDMVKTMQVLEFFALTSNTVVDCVNVRHIVRTLCRRSAALESAAIATIINRISMTPMTVGIDGGMVRTHPTYKEMLLEKVRCMVNPRIQFSFLLSEDGGGKGAALVVASMRS